jgi:hypothetical protein
MDSKNLKYVTIGTYTYGNPRTAADILAVYKSLQVDATSPGGHIHNALATLRPRKSIVRLQTPYCSLAA